ncbi:hypothetical protein QMZ20_23195, partial [Serratia bockelmannii]|nr:hypothetical protein [Serratia bockelmannii]
MRVLHIEIEQIALEEHTVPADYGGVNIWTAKHLKQALRPLYFYRVNTLSERQNSPLDERKSVLVRALRLRIS